MDSGMTKKQNAMLQRLKERTESKPALTGAAVKDKEVLLNIRLKESERDHYMIEARKAKTDVSTVVREALKDRFGEPE